MAGQGFHQINNVELDPCAPGGQNVLIINKALTIVLREETLTSYSSEHPELTARTARVSFF